MIYPLIYSTTSEPAILHDTIVSIDDKFCYEPKYRDTSLLFINFRKGIYERLTGGWYAPLSNEIMLLWHPGKKVEINGVFNENSIDYEAKGDEFNHDYSLIRRKTLKDLEKCKHIELQLDSSSYFGENNTLIDSLFAKRSAAMIPVRQAKVDYILNNPSKELSGYYLSQSALDTAAKYHIRLSPEVRNGIFGTLIDHQLNKYKKYTQVQENKSKIQPGNAAPDFTLPAITGSPLSLYSVNAEFIVLDFWGSWCAPCISAMPKMKRYYQKYGKKAEFIGIACNDTEKSWKKAVSDHQPEWPQVINAGQDNVAVRYAVEAYPTKIIMDKNKTIIAVFQGEVNDFYDKLNELFRENH
ncbi:MAG: TlpA family protein disulfide reductase [Prevotellaceae bacterium]|jgi:thiol-disulfide isomerase/thioredoxin|nr:TlpA family protein disulfide reductase [Prevotellaceae bacterium]